MPFRTPDSSREDSQGLRAEFRALIEESSVHLRTRGELLGIEAKEASLVCRRRIRLAIIALGLITTGYLLLLASLVGILGTLFSGAGLNFGNWIGAALLLALLHLIPGFSFLSKFRKSGKDASFFRDTLNELRKDQQWLSHEKTN